MLRGDGPGGNGEAAMNIRGGLALGILAALLLAASPVRAGALDARITDEGGKPVADAVISLVPDDAAQRDQAAPALWEPLRRAVIDQRDETFIPYVVVIGQGGSVVFHNGDTPHHHVYSFSPTKSFEFVLAPGAESAPVVFDKPGVAAIGCNIHDQMIAYVYVADTPWVAQTDKAGTAHIAAVPDGSFTATIWHPSQRPGRPLPTQKVTIGAAPAALALTLSLLPPKHHDREHGNY